MARTRIQPGNRRYGGVVIRDFDKEREEHRARQRALDDGGPPSAASIREGAADTVIRTSTASDKAFILDSWCTSYWASPMVRGVVDKDVYKVEMRSSVAGLLSSSRLFVACDESAPDSIRGWVCCEPPRERNGLWLVHYLLVRPEWQRTGIASALLAPLRDVSPQGMLWATHWSQGLRHFGTDYMMYNPFILAKVKKK